MARGRTVGTGNDPFSIHDDHQPVRRLQDEYSNEATEAESEDSRADYDSEESDCTDDAVDPAILEDIQKFNETFKGISDRFRLINRIGEGTFSTVYKAEDLHYEAYENEWDIEQKENMKWSSPPLRKRKNGESIHRNLQEHQQSKQKNGPQYVAIKKIYVTSSPMRIQNELELLYALRGCDSVCPLITAFRNQDQVVAVLPYFRHVDFREYFRDLTVPDMRVYFRSLFTALAAVHKQGILHRDIKPTNFLYDIDRRRGVLVDFGLAEREGTDCSHCLCHERSSDRRERISSSVSQQQPPATGYPKNDSRPSKRANRAGTRGFRAPEVLLKCTYQTTKIDIWSAGVILLTILSRRFPFFNSTDDIEAMIEIASIFGSRRMKACALLHGSVFQTSIPTISEKGFPLERIVLWSTGRAGKEGSGQERELSQDELQALAFLMRCLELDPFKRISAQDALEHDFLAAAGEGGAEEDEMELL